MRTRSNNSIFSLDEGLDVKKIISGLDSEPMSLLYFRFSTERAWKLSLEQKVGITFYTEFEMHGTSYQVKCLRHS